MASSASKSVSQGCPARDPRSAGRIGERLCADTTETWVGQKSSGERGDEWYARPGPPAGIGPAEYLVFKMENKVLAKRLGYYPGNSVAEAIEHARVACSLPSKVPGLGAWLVRTLWLERRSSYKPLKTGQNLRFNEGALSRDGHSSFLNCRKFVGRTKGVTSLFVRMSACGSLLANANVGAVMGKGGGSGYVGYKRFPTEEVALNHLRGLAYNLIVCSNSESVYYRRL